VRRLQKRIALAGSPGRRRQKIFLHDLRKKYSSPTNQNMISTEEERVQSGSPRDRRTNKQSNPKTMNANSFTAVLVGGASAGEKIPVADVFVVLHVGAEIYASHSARVATNEIIYHYHSKKP
jgi:hypothetical protein